jgi:hypothetical protein
MHPVAHTLLLGLGATAAIDLWALLRRYWLGIALPDYALLGRWLGHMPAGRFRHEAIQRSPSIAGERLLGWTAHYLIGIAFAALLPALWGSAWLEQPRLGPAVLIGIATVAAPLLLMQPGMGAGLAARRAPRPNAARLQSLITHLVFGLGLYATALVLTLGD